MRRFPGIFLQFSCWAGPQVLDWIRSIYFSLVGSAVMAFCLKAYVLSAGARWYYLGGLCLFLTGLLYSVKITSRFKVFDERHKEYDPEMPIKKFYFKEDKPNIYQHVLLYTVVIPALLCIYLAGKTIDTRIEDSNGQMRGQLNRIEDELKILDSIGHHPPKRS